MKLKIEIEDGIEKELILRSPVIDDEVIRIRSALEQITSTSGEIALKTSGGEIFVSYSELYFFEVSGDKTFAHTKNDCFVCPLHLFELEDMLPRSFCRASKSILVNSAKIRSLTRSATGIGEATFAGTEKKVFISRMYFKAVREVIEEMRLHK